MSGREGQEWHWKRNSPFRESSYIRDHNYRRKTKGRAMQRIHEAEQNEESWRGRTAGLQTHHAPEWQNGHGHSASGAYYMGCGGHEPDDGYPSQEQLGGRLSCWAFIPSLWIRPLWDTMRLPLVTVTSTSHDPVSPHHSEPCSKESAPLPQCQWRGVLTNHTLRQVTNFRSSSAQTISLKS